MLFSLILHETTRIVHEGTHVPENIYRKLKKKNDMSPQQVIICQDLADDLTRALTQCPYDQLFVLTDENTREYCWKVLANQKDLQKHLSNAHLLCIRPGDTHKTLEELAQVWTALGDQGATRHSLLLNLGGGMVTDLGGFAAATFKRGIRFINLPTTLLAMVDASVGGKTGINFHGLKNEIGNFAPAEYVLIDGTFLRTLDRENLLSGYAEMLKHGLISTTAHWAELLQFNFDEPDYRQLQTLAGQSVQVKEGIVAQDPFEKGIRKALNLGHTVGHAFESFCLETGRPVLHGYAVAWGLVCELYLSHLKTSFPADKLRQTLQFIREHYGSLSFDCKQYDRLYELMTHDKKNTAGTINFTLLSEIGDIQINQSATKEEIFGLLDFYRETME